MKVRVLWVPEPSDSCRVLTRGSIDPLARESHKPVTLAWIKAHAQRLAYEVRWWKGPSSVIGEWETQEFPTGKAGSRRTASVFSDSVKDARNYAAMIAGSVTPYEVEVRMRGYVREPGNANSKVWGVVWIFGHYKRDDEESRALRGES